MAQVTVMERERVSTTVTWAVGDPITFTTAAASARDMLYAAVQEAMWDAVAGAALDDLVADRERLSSGLLPAVAGHPAGRRGTGHADRPRPASPYAMIGGRRTGGGRAWPTCRGSWVNTPNGRRRPRRT
ncbi:hypothetical protein [Actinomadura rugatobispora]|uniref:Uncharacterized protein n=1 Tax=Actinomadura rugatobispora TaxID=1994 RepID=A0ABW1AFH6_9ACTN|nr:hypothetical protein GCM10010200_020110 [Actinomadura rugatobispora]